ncbi:uncharacterized protein LOC123553570 [Mercenaria mercenaria]|uniref:uncharacterized protein LOC123553570 n=1 Tax=Mercenaria mercenaria TaxID=6596 RepID=UPI00234F835B|nr:uncharacterized protein LOC123553570 [Mercenaria mercenaria]
MNYKQVSLPFLGKLIFHFKLVLSTKGRQCAPPEVLDPNSNVIGNKRTVGARILHKCKKNVSITSVCGEDGQWSEQQFDCYLAYLEGKQIKIITKEINIFWHFNGNGDLKLSNRWQPDDMFSKFLLEKLMNGSYKIKSVAKPSFYVYDGFDVPGMEVLYGKVDSDDDRTRYLVSM